MTPERKAERCRTCGKAIRKAGGRKGAFYPFCSERCRLVDLGRWFSGDYRIPGEALARGSEEGVGEEEGQSP